jgi:DNA modification methylase
VISEDTLTLVEGGQLGVRLEPNYFSQIVPFGAHERAEAIFQIEKIVNVQGDIRRGARPFPHPFPARMPVEVARAAVSALSKPGDTILDPMIGSGVVAKAALALGRNAIGRDVDPLAIIQSRALCARITANKLDTLAHAVQESAAKVVRSKKYIDAEWRSLDDEGRHFIRYWFRKKHAEQLFALSLAIDAEIGTAEWPIFAAIFSSLIISRGSGASRAMDLSRSRPHRVDSKIPKSPFLLWQKQVDAFRTYYEKSSLAGIADLKIGDARDLRLADESVDGIVTSPPYLNAIDYMRTSKFSLVFLGSRLDKLRAIRSAAIGTEVGLSPGHLRKSLDVMIDRRVADPARRPMIRRYLFDLHSALLENFRVLKPGGFALYVMGPSILSRRDYDAAEVLCDVAREVGFRPVGHGRRDLSETRRSLPPPRRSKLADSINRRMTCEFYVVLTKETG